MDPRYEQRLREEVIYLHSLWHQGPPRPSAAGPAPGSLQPSSTTHFKRERRSRGQRGNKANKTPKSHTPESHSSPGKEWPCAAPPREAASSWGSLAGEPAGPQPSSFSPEEQLKFAAKKAQSKALKTVREFLESNRDDPDSQSGSIGSSSDEDDEFLEENDGRQEYTFFLKVFMEDAELKDYYEKNFAKGEFSCLVCGAMGGKNTGKRFKGCLPLVQHTNTVAKTKKKRAHRAYGQAVCKVVGWDIDRLPAVASLLSDNLGEGQVDEKVDDKDKSIGIGTNVVNEDGNNGEVVPESGSWQLPCTGEGIMVSQEADDKDNSNGIGVSVVCEDVNSGEVVPEDATLGGGPLPCTDIGITSSLTPADCDNTFEGLDMVLPFNVRQILTEGLTINFSVADDGNNPLEGHEVVALANVEETVAEGLTSGHLLENGGAEIGTATVDREKEEDGTNHTDLAIYKKNE